MAVVDTDTLGRLRKAIDDFVGAEKKRLEEDLKFLNGLNTLSERQTAIEQPFELVVDLATQELTTLLT